MTIAKLADADYPRTLDYPFRGRGRGREARGRGRTADPKYQDPHISDGYMPETLAIETSLRLSANKHNA